MQVQEELSTGSAVIMHRMLNEVKAGTIVPVDASFIYDRILKLQREQSRLR